MPRTNATTRNPRISPIQTSARNSASGRVPVDTPSFVEPLLFANALNLAKTKADNDTLQWQSFESSLDAELGDVVYSSYYYDRTQRAADYALGYYCLRTSNPSKAADYAGKAISLALSAIRDSNRDSSGPVQFIAQGDGSTTQFTLPGTSIVSGSVVVYSVPLTAKAITKGSSNSKDNLDQFNTVFRISKIVKIVNTNSVTASAAYTAGVDYNQCAYSDAFTLGEEVIDWSLGGSEPSPGNTYYAVSGPIGNGAHVVSSSDYSITGTTLTFDSAPANDRAIFVSCLYHTDTLRYQQTGNGLGGLPVFQTADNMYPARYFAKGVASTFDWCANFAPFASELKTEIADELVALSDLSRDVSYAPASWIESNYGAGQYINRVFAAVALQGKHAEASRLETEIETLYVNYIYSKFGEPTATTSSLKGGFPGEGLSSYGQETTEHILLGTAAIAAAGWSYDPIFPESNVSNWASEVIRFNLHARYNESVNTQVAGENRPGSSYEGGDNGVYPCPSVSKRIYAIASGMSGSGCLCPGFARYLIANKAGDLVYDAWDLLFRDEEGTETDWTTEMGLTYTASGRGVVFSRAAWDYTSTWLAFACGNRGDCDHDEPGAGDLTVYKGNDKLLVTASAIGKRYNNDPSGPWSNIVTIDDGGDNLQSNRWSSTAVFGDYQGIDRPGVRLLSVDESNGHVCVSADYKAIYAKNSGGTNPCTNLDCEVLFIPASGYVFRYDRVTTSSSAHAKHYRLHAAETTHPVGSGTITLSKSGGGTGNAVAWNASAATIKSEVDALYSVTTTVTKLCDGYWIVTFPAGTHAALTGISSVGGAIVEIYDYHPEGGSGAGTIQHIVLANTISGTQQKDVGSSRMFLRVDSSDTLTKTETLIDAALFGSGDLCRRLSFRPTSAVATTRFATAIQITTTATSSMDAADFVTGSSSKLQGYKIAQLVVLFRMNSTFSPPDTIAITGSGTITWHVTGLVADTTYDLTGAVEDTVMTNGYGTAVFTTSATNPSVTIAAYTPPAASFAKSAVDLGMTSDFASWYTAEQTRQSTSSPTWWQWQVCPSPGTGNGDYPWLLVGHHSYTNNPGVRYYRNNYVSNGNSLTGGFADVTNSVLGGNAWQLGGLGGMIVVYDIDGDGQVDHACKKAATPNQNVWRITSGTLTVQSGVSIDSYGNYIEDIGDFDADGDVDIRSVDWPAKLALTALSDAKIRTLSYNGSAYSSSIVDFALPAGVPSEVAADCLSRLRGAVIDAARLYTFTMDLDDDGTDDFVIMGAFAYESQSNFVYYLKNDGAGNYTDKTTDWGLSRNGTFLPIQPYFASNYPRWLKSDNHLQKSIDGSGTLCLFVGGGDSAAGYYKWNGSGYTKQTSDLTTLLRNATVGGVVQGATDDYLAQLYAVDMTNSGRLDLVYHRARFGGAYLFLNNGSGVFTQHSGGGYPYNYFRVWTPYGISLVDLNNDGLIDMVCGGNDGTGSGGSSGPGGTASRVLTCYKNDTSNAGNYLKIKLRRSTTNNPFGTGGTVEVFTAGQSFNSNALIRRWRVDPSGLPMHFGVGAATTVDVRVNWPTGSPSTQTGVNTNQTITFTA